MNGDDATGKDRESKTPQPLAPELRSRTAVPVSDIAAGQTADLPSAQVPPGRRISFTAWGVAGIVGIMLWVFIIKLF